MDLGAEKDVASLWGRRFGSTVDTKRARIITAIDPDYDDVRAIYNRYHDRRPAVIIQSRDPALLAEVIEFSGQENVPLAVRGGGHHIGGYGTCDNGVVIDFSAFRTVTVDGRTNVAHVNPGAKLSDVDETLWRAGRVLPLGTVSQTGIAGLTIGGGIGWLVGQHGLTCDNLIGADVLLASGRVVRAEDPEHADLLWSLKGGGGGMGVVLGFRYNTHPARRFRAGTALIDVRNAKAAFARLAEFLELSCPANLSVSPAFTASQGGAVELTIDYCSWGEDHSALDAMLAMLEPLDVSGVDEHFPAWQQMSDARFLPPKRGYWKSRYGSESPARDFAPIMEQLASRPFASVSVSLEHFHGAFFRYGIQESAFPLRDCKFGWLISCRWTEADQDENCIEWVRGLYRAIDPSMTAAGYVNYASQDDVRPSVLSGRPGGARLIAAKDKYDPDNRFRINALWR